MSTTTLFITRALLPWDDTREDRLRLWIPIILLILLAILLSIAIQRAPGVSQQRYQPEKMPDRMARFIMEQKAKPVIPPKPKVEKKTPIKEKAKTQTAKTTPKPTPAKPSEEAVNKARAQAAKRVAAFQDAFAGLRDMAPNAGTGAMAGKAHDLQRGGDQAASIAPGRDLITSAAGVGSSDSVLVGAGRASGRGSWGGTGNGQLAGGGNIGGKVHSGLAEAGAGSSVRQGPGGQTRRSDEEIRRVFDRYAGLINSQYQRALRDNPTLQGTVVLHMTITPDGKVTAVAIKSSELNDPGLLDRLKLIVSSMDFGKLPVDTWKGDYSLNFFPS
jgi:outer membrane biosynthesis protein TonB